MMFIGYYLKIDQRCPMNNTRHVIPLIFDYADLRARLRIRPADEGFPIGVPFSRMIW